MTEEVVVCLPFSFSGSWFELGLMLDELHDRQHSLRTLHTRLAEDLGSYHHSHEGCADSARSLLAHQKNELVPEVLSVFKAWEFIIQLSNASNPFGVSSAVQPGTPESASEGA
jgi:hypothetical protein